MRWERRRGRREEEAQKWEEGEERKLGGVDWHC